MAAPTAEAIDAGRATAQATMPTLYNAATGLLEPQRTPTVFKSLKAQSITAGTPVAVWTPATGKRFRLLGYEITAVGAGSAAIIFEDGSGGSTQEFLRTQLVNSSTPLDTPSGFGNGYLSTTINNQLFLDATANTAVTGFLFGTEE